MKSTLLRNSKVWFWTINTYIPLLFINELFRPIEAGNKIQAEVFRCPSKCPAAARWVGGVSAAYLRVIAAAR